MLLIRTPSFYKINLEPDITCLDLFYYDNMSYLILYSFFFNGVSTVGVSGNRATEYGERSNAVAIIAKWNPAFRFAPHQYARQYPSHCHTLLPCSGRLAAAVCSDFVSGWVRTSR